MENLGMLNLIIGFFSPLIISLVNQPQWTKGVKVAIMVSFSIVAGLLTSYFLGDLNGVDVITSILIVCVSSITAYKGVFKPSGISDKIEAASSPKPVTEIYSDNRAG